MDTNNAERIFLASASGTVWNLFPNAVYTDNGAAIPWHFTFGPNYMGNVERDKRWRTMVVAADSTYSPTAAAHFSVNGGSMDSGKTLSLSTSYTRTGAVKTGRYIQVKMSGSNDSFIRIKDIELRAGMENPRRL